jgi:branched-chain amino acid transport system permease protein
MNRLKSIGLWVSILAVVALGLGPIVNHSASLRETIYIIMQVIVLAASLNVLLGFTGYVSFGHIVFFGLGGYVGLYLINAQNWPLWSAAMAGGATSGLLAFLLGKAILRLRGAYFALATIGINEAMRAFINNFDPFGGPIGMTLNFRVYNSYGGAANALWTAYYVVCGLALLAVLLNFTVKNSKFGLGLMAIREDEDAAEVMGVVTPNAKTWAFVLSAILPGVVGTLFFFKNGHIEPSDAFRLDYSIEMLVIVMLGGQGSVFGPILGAAGYEGLRNFLLTSPIFKNIQLSVAGALLLVIILFIPAGAVGWLRRRVPMLRKVLV